MARPPQHLLALIGLSIITLFWGVTFIMVKWTVAEMDVYTFLFIRFLIATVLLALFFWKKLKGITKETIVASAILSAFLAVAYITQTEGLRFTSASNAALITGLYIVLTPILAALHLKTRPSILSTIGIIFSLFGLFLLTQYNFTRVNFGDAIILICALACAWHITLTGKFALSHNHLHLVILQFFFITILCGAIAWAKGTMTFTAPAIGWITIVVSSIFATAIAFLVQTWAQRYVDPTRVSLIFALEAVFGTLFGWWWGNETMSPTAFMGACLMILGMMVAEIRPVAKYVIDKITG